MDYIHYVARRVTMTAPKGASEQDVRIGPHDDSGGFSRPEYHQTRMHSWPARQIARNDTIWLISQLVSPWGVLPPSLDARIDVGDVICCTCGVTRFEAKRSSAWYLLKDARHCLDTLWLLSQDGTPRKLLNNHRASVGQALQSIRLLRTDCGETLRRYAHAVEASPFDFVSYRHLDGTKRAFELVAELLASGSSVYWDRWALPRRLIERREAVNCATLTRHLHKRIRKAQRVWGVLSETYFDPTKYAAKEMRVGMEMESFLRW
jgi:hypothetical protein